MIEIIKEILSHLLMIIATTIATLIGGWAALVKEFYDPEGVKAVLAKYNKR